MQNREKQSEVWEKLCGIFTETNIKYLNKEEVTRFLLNLDDDKDSKAVTINAKNPLQIPFTQKEVILQHRFFPTDIREFVSKQINIPRGGNRDKTNISKDEKERIIETIEDKITGLYKETLDFLNGKNDDLYSKEQIAEISIERKLQYLVYFCVFGSFYPAPFNTTQNKNKFRNCENYKERPEIICQIEESLRTDNILVIKSKPGMGKTQIVKEYIHKLLNNNSDEDYEVVLINEECSSVEEMINQSEDIIPPIEVSLEQALEEKDNNCILVVECSYLTIEDCEYLLEFHGKNIRFIVAVCGIPEEYNSVFQVLELKPLAVDQLFDVFKGNIGKRWSSFFEADEFERLLKIIDFNTLIVVALAKILNKYLNEDETHIDEKINYIKEKIMDSHQWIWKEAVATRIRINNRGYFGEKSSYSLTHFIRSLISQFKISEEDGVAELALWVSGKMSVPALSAWCQNPQQINKAISILLQCGLAEYMDEKEYIYICPFISDMLWLEYLRNSSGKENTRLTLPAYGNCIKNFLEQIKRGAKRKYPYWIYYKAAYTLVYRMRSELSAENQRSFKKKDWEDLWTCIGQIIVFFLWCGNAEKAEQLNRQLGVFLSKTESNWGDRTFIEKEENKKDELIDVKQKNALYTQILNNGIKEEILDKLLNKAEKMRNMKSAKQIKAFSVWMPAMTDFIDMIIGNTIWLYNDMELLEENKLIALYHMIEVRNQLPQSSEYLMHFYYSAFYYIKSRQDLWQGKNSFQESLKMARYYWDNVRNSDNYDQFSAKTDLNAVSMEVEILLYELNFHLIDKKEFEEQRLNVLERNLSINKLLEEHFLSMEISSMKVKSDILILLITGDLEMVTEKVLTLKELYGNQIQLSNEKYLSSLNEQIQSVLDLLQ